MNTSQKTSIIIPAYNEEGAIRFGLEKLINLNFHAKYEVIYIDDGSTDKTTLYPTRANIAPTLPMEGLTSPFASLAI